ncbi:uracil-DNA glycosylase family protein [Thauera linaloolentis]|uniref:uracil-DNA glycosylase family protein n=1 Tax=Thauera linaloolentis TaxID=76112 RepID=UPI0009D993FE|nr:uracil-DNA glycosylase family protein [Thauera linaloolentis]MCM8565785.1 hypothetical protein [Thauera linaloolentis]
MPSSYIGHCISCSCPYTGAEHLSCAERSIRSQPIPLENNGSSILLVFQSPGADEWKNGKPISSSNPRSAAMKLKSALETIGLDRESFDIANVVQCFPGKKEPRGTGAPRDKNPVYAAVSACSKWLHHDIRTGQYERVVVFGCPAKRALHRLGYKNDSRFVYVRHPSASGVSISQLAENLANPSFQPTASAAAELKR